MQTSPAALPLILLATLTACGADTTGPDPIPSGPVATLAMSTPAVVVGTGLTTTLAATPKDAGGNVLTGRTITWTSRTPATATVSASGVVTAGAPGTSWVVAESETIKDSSEVTVVDGQIAFAWNDNASTAGASTPEPEYSYNPTGAANTMNRTGPGLYTVGWTGLTVPSGAINAQFVTAYSPSNGGFCMDDNWGGSQLIFRCYDSAGVLADQSSTTVVIGSGTLAGRSAFAWVDSPTTSAEASGTWRHHPLGRSIFSEHLATGSYVVRFAGLQRASASDREGVVVTAYGPTAAVCQSSAPTSTTTALEVAVRCFDATGAPVDSRYTILLADRARVGASLGFALADQPTAATYTPANSAVRGTGSVLITRASVGVWDVAFTGFARSGTLKESFIVSPVGTTAGRCWIEYWDYSSTAGGTGTVRVGCSTVAGVAADMPFSVVAVQ
jgi:hypothetical protein